MYKGMKTSENAYEGENRSLHMKERIGYGVGDFANNMFYKLDREYGQIVEELESRK